MKQSAPLIASAILLAIAVPASAMPVSEFLPKADKLVNAGMGAMFSKHRKPVMTEMKKVTKGYRADIQAARAAGKKNVQLSAAQRQREAQCQGVSRPSQNHPGGTAQYGSEDRFSRLHEDKISLLTAKIEKRFPTDIAW